VIAFSLKSFGRIRPAPEVPHGGTLRPARLTSGKRIRMFKTGQAANEGKNSFHERKVEPSVCLEIHETFATFSHYNFVEHLPAICSCLNSDQALYIGVCCITL
jgi:hypothetical protein